MAEIDPVILQLRADLRDYQENVVRAERLANQRFGAIERVGDRMATGLQRSFSRVGTALASVATLATAREILRLVDASKQIEAQLRLATRETGSFAQAQDDVRRISATTRTDLESTTRLYSVFARDSAALGISQEQAARATETLSKSFLISGATAVETAQSTRQLIQGLQSGTLRGDEFNSVMEAAPRLQKLFAQALGVSKGELRALAEDGKITAAALVDALTNTKFTQGIDAEFRELPVTFDQAMTQVHNAAVITFGAFDRGGQFSTALANFITDGSGGFADLETAAESFGRTVSSELAGVIAIASNLVGEINAIGSALSSLSGGALNSDFLTQTVKNAMPGAFITNLVRASPAYSQARDAQASALRGQAGEQFIADMFRGFDVMGNRIAPSGPSGPTAAATKPTRRTGPSAETLAARAERDRLRAIREEADGARELAQLQDDIVAARAAMATAAEDILSFELQQISSEKEQRLAGYRTEVRLGQLTEDEYNQRAALVEEEARLRGQRLLLLKAENDVAAAAAQQARELQDEADTIGVEAQLARTREERAGIERRILEAAYRQEEFAIRQDAANGDITNLDEALANLKRRKLAEEQLLSRTNMSPGERYLDDLQSEAENLGDAYENIAVRGLERMNEALSESVKNALGLHGALGDIIGDFIELAIRQQILGPLAQGLFGGGGLLGGLFGGGGGGKIVGLAGGPKLASGGSMRLGGMGGVDNNQLSLNGQPLARVSRGETMHIVPNQSLASGGSGGQPAIVRLIVGEGQMFEPRVEAISGRVSVEVVRTAAPTLIDASANETARRFSRPSL